MIRPTYASRVSTHVPCDDHGLVWGQDLERVISKGSTTENKGGLSGIAEARKIHKGQFFTPISMAEAAWSLIKPSAEAWFQQHHRRLRILDTSIGSARLERVMDPSMIEIHGCDIDGKTMVKVRQAMSEAECPGNIMTQPMERIQLYGEADIAILNPPFSIVIDDPHLMKTPSNTHGPAGPMKRCMSHYFAVHQAAQHAAVVIAILPSSAIQEFMDHPSRLPLVRAYPMKGNAFSDEGADVHTSICVFAEKMDGALTDPCRIVPLSYENFLQMEDRKVDSYFRKYIPVTHRPGVRFYRHGRDIRMEAACGSRQQDVMKIMLGRHLDEFMEPEFRSKIPAVISYEHQGWTDREAIIASPDPDEAWKDITKTMRSLGSDVTIDQDLMTHMQRHIRKKEVALLPFPQWIKGESGGRRILKKHLPCSKAFGAPIIAMGTSVDAVIQPDGSWRVDSGKRHAIVSADDINNYVSIADREWKRIGVSMKDRRPDLWKNADAVITSLRIDDFFSRDFQKNDVREVYSRQSNAIIGYDMGLGKTRFSLALALLGGKHNLIVVPAHLVDEVMLEVKACGLTDQSHVIQSSHDVSHLKKINIISYSCLKKPLGGFRKPTQDASDEAKSDEKDDDSDDTKPGVAWRTIGDLLRNRIHTVICDEAHVLSNKKSQQTQAVMRVGGRRRYALTGTPIQNYVRNLTGLMTWIGGDGTCRQPFGFKRPFITPYLYKNTAVSERGQDVFAERHVTLEWVTHEFRDDLESGAKREIPKVKNAKALQDVLAPLMLRRSVDEPDVSKYFHVPKPTVTSVKVAWNTDHLIHYYKVCTEFKNWYVSSENKHNLAQVLIKIRAVDNAANIPFINGPGGLFHGTSSKMESALQRIKEWVHDGHRVIVGSQRPAISLLIANGLNAMGIETIAHHGQIPIHKRNKTLYAKFVNGTTPVLSATIQSLQTGYNLWMADRVLMLEHDWTSKSEDQFIRRVLRPQQKKQVEVEFMELDGSIDVYKGQMAGQKRTTSQLIIDHEGDESNQEDFKHMEHILYDFVKGTDGLQAMLEDRVKK